MKDEFNLGAHDGEYLKRMFYLLRKVRRAIEVESNFLCNELHHQGRAYDLPATNLMVLWIAAQLETDVHFANGEMKCYSTLSEYLDKAHGHVWRDINFSGSTNQLMRMAWCDKMLDTLEQECLARGMEPQP